MRDRLLTALREVAARHPQQLPTVAEVAAMAETPESVVREHLGPPENFAALLSFQPQAASAPMPSNETRDRILAGAARVFARKSYQRATLDEVAAEVGLTKGAIYWHFRSKTDLFTALLDQRFREETAPLAADIASASQQRDGVQALAGVVRSVLHRCQQDPDWPRLYFDFLGEAMRQPEVRARMAGFYEAFWALGRQHVEIMKQAGLTAPDLDSDMLAVFWGALVDGLILTSLIHGDRINQDQLVDKIMAMLWTGLAPRGERT